MNSTMIDQSSIERTVMRRVHLIRILKLVISTVVLAVLTALTALWGIGREVWVARVFQNTPENLLGLPQFYLAAFANTSLIVQTLTILTLFSLMFLAYETVRFFASFFTPAQA